MTPLMYNEWFRCYAEIYMPKSPLLHAFGKPSNDAQEAIEYVYHIQQPNMEGETLYPLNVLKVQKPNCYESAVKKYIGRESILSTRVEASDALWNDHLFFSPIDPRLILAKRAELGCDDARYAAFNYYKIPVSRLRDLPVFCYEYQNFSVANDPDIMNSETRQIDLSTYENPDSIRKSTQDHWKSKVEAGGQPLLFEGIPHLLVRGNVHTMGCEVKPLVAEIGASSEQKFRA